MLLILKLIETIIQSIINEQQLIELLIDLKLKELKNV